MSYKAINNQAYFHISLKTISANILKSDSWRNRIYSKVSRIFLTSLMLVVIAGLFANPQTLPNIIGTISLTDNSEDVVYTSVKLYNNSNNNYPVDQVYPDTQGKFAFSPNVGNYYLIIEMFRPDLNKFTYPITTQVINIPNTSYCYDFGTIHVDQYSMSTVMVSSDPAHSYFKCIDQALNKIFDAVHNGYNGHSVNLFLSQNELMPSGFNLDYTNPSNDALNLNIIGMGAEGVLIEPYCSDGLLFQTNRVNTIFNRIKFKRSSSSTDRYFLSFGNSPSSKYSFNNCHFDGTNSRYSSVTFDGLSELFFNNCVFQHIKNNNYAFYNSGKCRGSVRFKNCSDVSINGSYFTCNLAYGGGAIYLDNCEEVAISDCEFVQNIAADCLLPGNNISFGHSGGAIYIENSSEINILNNRFAENITTGEGGPVYLQLTSLFNITGNTFIDNEIDYVTLTPTQSDALGFSQCTFTSDDIISHNIIHSGHEVGPIYPVDFIAICSSCTGTLNISNGVFIKGDFDFQADKRIVKANPQVNLNFSNCVFQTRDIDASFDSGMYPPNPANVSVSYSLFENGFDGVTHSAHNMCNVSDMALDENYYPIWNQSTLSPCIDAGTGDYDPDGTPPDIGAFSAVAHDYWEYTFHDQSDAERWHWVSYPILNTVTDGALLAREFFKELLHKHIRSNLNWYPTYLEEIQWYNQYPYSITWDNNYTEWNNEVDNHYVSSPQGYKIRLQQRANLNFPHPLVFKESGFKTPVNTEFPIYGGVENWLGYFKEESQSPEAAFSTIWQDVTMVKGKDWSLIRNPLTGMMTGVSGIINFGDMVIVKTNQNHNFRWGNSHPVPPRTKGAPEEFIFDEKSDYIPMYINIADEIRPGLKEIGLMVNGVCKGAVVVEESLEQISAYVDSARELSEGDIEFVFYYGESKSAGAEVRKMNVPAGKLSARYGVAGSAYPYFEIDLGDNALENVIPLEFALKQNYPNPFNPSTTIQYSLPEATKMRLEIYNIKGQLIKTLVNGEMPAGMHSVVWNGRDMNNQAVVSGVYFYRISSPQNTQTKRMLLMK